METSWRGLPFVDHSMSAGDRDQLLHWKEKLLNLPEMKPFLSADVREAEVSFLVPLGGRTLRGIVDLLAKTDERWLILDYKTDRAGSGKILTRYSLSLNLYRLALRALLSESEMVEAWIYAAREGMNYLQVIFH